MSDYRISIVRADGQRVLLLPGRAGTSEVPGEHDLIQLCTAAIVAKGVGLFKTEAQVRRAIEFGLAEALLSLKVAVLPKPK